MGRQGAPSSVLSPLFGAGPTLASLSGESKQADDRLTRDQLQRLQRGRLARESAKLDPQFEQALADEGLTEDYEQWPDY